MQNIFWGVVIIAIGLGFGQSVFYGHFSVLNLIFDGLGLFWIGKGVLGLVRRDKTAGPA
ncbi:MAG TPA: hypothetical protein VGE22_01950 [Solimonas sp.]|jgi:hypothetical protein